MGEELKPTLWRTARALANEDCLNLMRIVCAAKGAKGVSELAAVRGSPLQPHLYKSGGRSATGVDRK